MKRRVVYFLAMVCTMCLLGCSAHRGHDGDMHPVDQLNQKAAFWRYRNLDSTAHYAQLAYDEAGHYRHGRTVASNMLGFVAFMRMEYDEALYWYDEVDKLSGCELERLVSDVGRMNVYQRTADNLAFYDSRVTAMKRLAHINEEAEAFSTTEQERLRLAVNDLNMVTALHHFMIGQRPEAHAEMDKLSDDNTSYTDSAQWLMVQYLKGIGLDVEGITREQRIIRRYTHLNNCLRLSREGQYGYFEGLALSGLSSLLSDSVRRSYISQQRPNSFAQLGGELDAIPLSLATDALHSLYVYGDLYGVLNAKVQLASLYNRNDAYEEALSILQNVYALITTYQEDFVPSTEQDSILSEDLGKAMFQDDTGWIGIVVPDVQCRLHEEASLSYSGLGDKIASDYHRNVYLDLLETTRQDKELESRYLSLTKQRRTMNILLCAVVAGIVLLALLIVLLSRYRHRKGNGYEQQLRDLLQETEKRVYLHQRHIESGKRDNVVRKASFSMVTGMMPYIDRIAHEVERLQHPDTWNNKELRTRKLEYIGELTNEINNLNELLSQWIKTTQGMVRLQIESFALSEVFAMIQRGESSFTMKGLTLEVLPTDAVVKADKALTFFMLNTLAENARKFTPNGGRVCIASTVCDEYVELSVSDTGVGMSTSDINRILHEKVYDAATIGNDLPEEQHKNKGSGFGLLNCKGIIEKYRKTDSLFDVCSLGIDSRVGEGSRFWFRLPKGVRRTMALLCVIFCFSEVYASFPQSEGLVNEIPSTSYDTLLVQASAYADSVYFANVHGRYEEALAYADSALHYLNAHHRAYAVEYIDTLTSTRGAESDVETRWWLSNYATDYHTILDVRNELAVANLALRRWNDYRYNNRIYNDLYKLISEDRSLIDFCNRMQRYNSNISVAILICVLLVVGYLAIILYTFMGRVESVYRDIESIEDDERRVRHEENRLHVQNMVLDNCLSTIKHETVYYPNRIKQLVVRLAEHDERLHMKELIDYYRVVFTTLTECASRQLDAVTFRCSEVPVSTLLHRAVAYHTKRICQSPDIPTLTIEDSEEQVLCDTSLVDFLLEQLIDASLLDSPTDSLTLKAFADGDFVRFTLANTSRTLSLEELHSLFFPSRFDCVQGAHLQGAEYIVARQIIREHDSYFNHIGCRIKAELTSDGYNIWFTLPLCMVKSRSFSTA